VSRGASNPSEPQQLHLFCIIDRCENDKERPHIVDAEWDLLRLRGLKVAMVPR